MLTLNDVLNLPGETDTNLVSTSDNLTCGLTIHDFSCAEFDVPSATRLEEFFRVDANHSLSMDVCNFFENPFHIKYHFHSSVLRMPVIMNRLMFTVEEPIADLRVIERCYFRGEEFASYSWEFPDPCFPNETYMWDQRYTRSIALDALEDQMIAHPWQVTMDSFVVADNRLIRHTKASFKYSAEVNAPSNECPVRQS